MRRSRRLVVSSIATVGNYEYGFYWYFYLDGSIQLEVKLTGHRVHPGASTPGVTTVHAPLIAPGLAAPVHQHLFCARLDLDVDGPVNEVYEVDVVPMPPGDATTRGATRFVPVTTRLETEQAAQRDVDPARSRTWKIVNPTSAQPARPTGRLQARPRRHADAAGRPEHRASAGGPGSPATTSGSPLPPRRAPRRRRLPQPAPRRRRPAALDRRPTGHWSTPTSSCGTPSASPTSRAPRTGRSCRSSTAASSSAPVGFFDRNPALDVPPRRPLPLRDPPPQRRRSRFRPRPGPRSTAGRAWP